MRRAGPVCRVGSPWLAFLFDYISRAGKKKSREIRIKMAEQDIDKKKLIVIASLES